MADIATIRSTTREIEIVHPATGAEIGISVTLVSIDDERLKKIRRVILDERLALEQRGKQFKADQLEANKAKLLFAAMVDWRWYNPTGVEGDEHFNPDAQATFEGEIPDLTPRNVGRVFDALPWFADQINEAVGNTKDFFTN